MINLVAVLIPHLTSMITNYCWSTKSGPYRGDAEELAKRAI